MTSQRQEMDRILAVAITVASVAFIVAANWLPWASSNLGAVRFMAGPLAPFMTGIAIAAIALTAATLLRPSKLFDWLLIGLSTTAVILAVYSALHSISSANTNPGGGTAYRVGSGVGVLAALMLLVAISVRLGLAANESEVRPSG